MWVVAPCSHYMFKAEFVTLVRLKVPSGIVVASIGIVYVYIYIYIYMVGIFCSSNSRKLIVQSDWVEIRMWFVGSGNFSFLFLCFFLPSSWISRPTAHRAQKCWGPPHGPNVVQDIPTNIGIASGHAHSRWRHSWQLEMGRGSTSGLL